MQPKQLTKEWIQYLKNNQIVSSQSDPKTGALKYKQPVTAETVKDFLLYISDYTEDEINAAIDSVSTSQQRSPTTQPAVSGTQQSQAVTTPGTQKPAEPAQRKKYSNDDATDVEPRYGPRASLPAPRQATPSHPTHTGGKKPGEISQTDDAKRKRDARAADADKRKAGTGAFSQMANHLGKQKKVNEAFGENTPTAAFSEQDIEKVFTILSQPKPSKNNKQEPSMPKINPQDVRTEELNKIKQLIRDTMTDQQRMALWRALVD